MKRIIQVGHSPDSDDAFMFYALAAGKIDTGEYEFRHTLQDIETLNQRALRGELEVSAVSIHAFAQLADRYALLSSGASMGDRYGPMVVAREPLDAAQLADLRIAIPGTMTSAYLALRLFLSREFEYQVIPFDQIIEEVKSRRVDAGLLIHEGQLTYGDDGLHKIVDLGEWWFELTGGLPLPLGGNVIRKDLGDEAMREVSRYIKQSIQFALDNSEDALDHAMQYARDLSRDRAERFVGMYVNNLTVDYGERGRQAVQLFLDKGHEAGIISDRIAVEFIS